MIVAALAQLRFAASILFALPFANWSLDRLIDAALATRREFGAIGVQAGALLTGPSLDPSVCREMQTRRLRSVARTAIHETAYYRHLFASLGVVPDGLQLGNLGALPLTPKVALRNTPDAFVRKSQRPILRALTTGTTGVPASVHFAADELHAIVSLSALGFLMQRQISPEDVVQISTSTTSVLGNLGLAGACARIGAVFSVPGTIQPERSLQMLSAVNRLQGKKPRTSVLSAHPSYLGQLVDTAEHLRYGPSAFGLERILTGGEIVTEGLKGRARRVFGDVVFHESYAMTETIPFGGTPCAQGHLHFQPAHGLMEIVEHVGGAPVGPGQIGTLVVTPFPPFRQTTLLLRYDTEDLVRRPAEAPTCELRDVPSTSRVLGKRSSSVQHADGWTTPRDVLEALETIDAVPLPARCGFRELEGGVAVEVVVRDNTAGVRSAVDASLQQRGVPVRCLRLVEDKSELQKPLPLRCDTREDVAAVTASEARG